VKEIREGQAAKAAMIPAAKAQSTHERKTIRVAEQPWFPSP